MSGCCCFTPTANAARLQTVTLLPRRLKRSILFRLGPTTVQHQGTAERLLHLSRQFAYQAITTHSYLLGHFPQTSHNRWLVQAMEAEADLLRSMPRLHQLHRELCKQPYPSSSNSSSNNRMR